jgi:hypothetical protein
VGDAPCAFAERAKALGLNGLTARGRQLVTHSSHSATKRLELRSAPSFGRFRQRFGVRDSVRPAYELIDWTTQLSAEVSGHTRRDQGEQSQRHKCSDG